MPTHTLTGGHTLLALQCYDAAVADYDKALSLKPDDAGIHYNRGNALLEQGRDDQAVANFSKALSLDPGGDFRIGHYLVPECIAIILHLVRVLQLRVVRLDLPSATSRTAQTHRPPPPVANPANPVHTPRPPNSDGPNRRCQRQPKRNPRSPTEA